ncbi:hypothetical protein ATO67_17140 [Agrobacterium bohemicum]|uniref:MOSC domain-containing protein n=1 Tax=Agrobacterium bohemicum TaxID=2052828 RepID=A0A135P8X0_9HYPH|nr:hypothetical protein ATO67_17140 [Agrobacterium bohemicum]
MALTLLGTVEEIWRYPVSSLSGEQLTSVEIEADGIPSDRNWCVVDAQSGNAASPEKEERWRPALFLQSRLAETVPEIGFPDGSWLAVTDPETGLKLSQHFGFAAAVWPYEKGKAPMREDHRVAVNRYEPSPLHLITTSSLDHLSNLIGTEKVHSKRFRPTIVLRTHGDAEFREKAWIGQRLQIGAHIAALASEETKRCGLTLIAQPEITENPEILRTILRQNRRNFGIYGSIETAGVVAIGDSVHLIDT